MGLFDELKRRNVFRVGAAYVVLGWLVVQVTETVSPALNLPDWTLGFVVWVGIIGLPFVLFFSWAYEITPEGVRKESEIDRNESITQLTARKLNVALVVLLAIAVAMLARDALFETPNTDARVADIADSARAMARDSIAVLPLLNMSAIPENEYFVGGIHEEILTNLSAVDDLRVVSRTTALKYLNSDLSLAEIGRELQARYIVEGSVRRINDHVRITVQLIDAAIDAHLWARNYDRELVDVFATQSEVAREITRSIQVEILPETVGSLDDLPTRSVKAYDLYTKAVSINRSEPSSESSYRRQRELLEAAVAEDPDFVEAWAHLNFVLDEISRTILQNGWFGETQAERDAVFAETRPAALRAINRAVALDPDNVETLLARATDFVAEAEDSEYRVNRRQYIDRALEIDPDNAFAWYTLGWWYHISDRRELAREPFLKALELDPLHAHMVGGALVHFRDMGDQEMTTLLAERLIQIAPEMGENEGLTRVTSWSRLNGIIAQLSETADASMIDAYARAFAEERDDFVGWTGFREQFWWHEAFLLQLQNDLDGLVNLNIGPLADDASHNEIHHFLHANYIVLSAQRVAGRSDDAQATARGMLEAAQKLKTKIPEFPPILAAHAALGDEDALREALLPLLDADDDGVRAMNPFYFVSIALLDVDRAAELLLKQTAKHPEWTGTDMIAMSHFVTRDLITQPDVQAYFVEQGKWVPYLAERVPEYAQ